MVIQPVKAGAHHRRRGGGLTLVQLAQLLANCAAITLRGSVTGNDVDIRAGRIDFFGNGIGGTARNNIRQRRQLQRAAIGRLAVGGDGGHRISFLTGHRIVQSDSGDNLRRYG